MPSHSLAAGRPEASDNPGFTVAFRQMGIVAPAFPLGSNKTWDRDGTRWNAKMWWTHSWEREPGHFAYQLKSGKTLNQRFQPRDETCIESAKWCDFSGLDGPGQRGGSSFGREAKRL